TAKGASAPFAPCEDAFLLSRAEQLVRLDLAITDLDGDDIDARREVEAAHGVGHGVGREDILANQAAGRVKQPHVDLVGDEAAEADVDLVAERIRQYILDLIGLDITADDDRVGVEL